MRRKVTLNLDEGFVTWLDNKRGLVPRSRFVETLAVDEALGRVAGTTGVVVAARSPVPPVESKSPRKPLESQVPPRPSDERVSELTGHKLGCRCHRCDTARNS